jgi:hypothetical protein
MMIDWILGKIATGDILKNAKSEYTALLLNYSAGIKERYLSVNSFPVSVDSKFCAAVDNVINL